MFGIDAPKSSGTAEGPLIIIMPTHSAILCIMGRRNIAAKQKAQGVFSIKCLHSCTQTHVALTGENFVAQRGRRYRPASSIGSTPAVSASRIVRVSRSTVTASLRKKKASNHNPAVRTGPALNHGPASKRHPTTTRQSAPDPRSTTESQRK